MPLIRALVEHYAHDDLPADYASHTVYHTIADGIFDPAVGYQNHANEIRDLFAGNDASHALWTFYNGRKIDVKVYDMADALPRPVRAVAHFTPGTATDSNEFGPSQVALVLAFFGTRNIPGHRGHIYTGPFRPTEMTQSAPPSALMSAAVDLGHGLFDIGGENVAHVVRSEKNGTTTIVQNYWCDNRWDTQRRRLPKPTSRVTLAP